MPVLACFGKVDTISPDPTDPMAPPIFVCNIDPDQSYCGADMVPKLQYTAPVNGKCPCVCVPK